MNIPKKALTIFILILVTIPSIFGNDNRAYPFYSLEDSSYLYLDTNGRINQVPDTVNQLPLGKGMKLNVSDDGETIIYYSGMNWDENGKSNNIYSFDSINQEFIMLTHNMGFSDFAIEDIDFVNKKVLFTEYYDSVCVLYHINTDATEKKELFHIQDTESFFARFFYPDKIIYGYMLNNSDQTTIFKMDIYTGENHYITSIDNIKNFKAISSSGKLIFDEYDSDKRDGYIDIKNNRIFYFAGDSHEDNHYFWSPDAKSIVFKSNKDGIEELYLLDVDTGGIKKLTHTKAKYVFCLDWIQNGSKFAFGISSFFDTGDVAPGIYAIDISNKQLEYIFTRDVFTEPPLACPKLYVYDSKDFVEHGEVLKNYINNDQAESIIIENKYIIDKQLRIRIKETLNEITYLNSARLIIGGKSIHPHNCPDKLKNFDDEYLVLKQNDYINLQFFIDHTTDQIILEISGYYTPIY